VAAAHKARASAGASAPDARRLARILDALEELHGRVRTGRAADPYELLVRAQCGYPASESACERGLAALSAAVGVSPEALLRAPKAKLVAAMRAGGIVPELRAQRLRDIAKRTEDLGGDLRAILKQPLAAARRSLKKFPTIGDPGADRILLLTRTAPIAAVPSNATQVPLRLGFGEEGTSYAAGYRSAQAALDAALPATFEARIRAHALLKQHGQEVCRRARPECDRCPVTKDCAWFARMRAS
jgi:endonuclease III